MLRHLRSGTIAWIAGLAVTVVAGAAFIINSANAQDKEPIKIGFAMSLTGFLSPNGKQALLGMKIWEERTNKAGGLLGRQVKLVYYDDKSSPAEIPGIYTKLLDVDKVDLVLGGLRHQRRRAGHADRDPQGQDLHQPVCARRERQVQLPEILLGAADRAGHQGLVHRGLLRNRGRAKAEAEDCGARLTPTPNSRRTPAKAPASTPRSTASRSSTTRPIRRRRRPPISRRSCARSRP